MTPKEIKVKKMILKLARMNLNIGYIFDQFSDAYMVLNKSLDDAASTLNITEYTKHVTHQGDIDYLTTFIERHLKKLNEIMIENAVLKDLVRETMLIIDKKLENVEEL